jgi:hypothetical protein
MSVTYSDLYAMISDLQQQLQDATEKLKDVQDASQRNASELVYLRGIVNSIPRDGIRDMLDNYVSSDADAVRTWCENIENGGYDFKHW